MSWFAELAGKAENLLNNLDEQTGAALRNNNVTRKRFDSHGRELGGSTTRAEPWVPKKRLTRSPKKAMPIPDMTKSVYSPIRKTSPTHYQSYGLVGDYQEPSRNGSVKARRSPQRKCSPIHPYNLENCPKTLVRDVRVKDRHTDTDVDQYAMLLKLRSKYYSCLSYFYGIKSYSFLLIK